MMAENNELQWGYDKRSSLEQIKCYKCNQGVNAYYVESGFEHDEESSICCSKCINITKQEMIETDIFLAENLLRQHDYATNPDMSGPVKEKIAYLKSKLS